MSRATRSHRRAEWRWMYFLAVWVIAVAVAPVGGQERGASPAARRARPDTLSLEGAVHILLMKDCSTGDSASELAPARFRELGPRVIPILWHALRYGPPPAELGVLREDARQDYQAILDLQESEHRRGPPSGDSLLTQSEYVAMQVRGFDIAYRERALNALLDLRPPGLRDSLESIGRSGVPPRVERRLRGALTR